MTKPRLVKVRALFYMGNVKKRLLNDKRTASAVFIDQARVQYHGVVPTLVYGFRRPVMDATSL